MLPERGWLMEWIQQFVSAVRSGNPDSGRSLFATDVTAFGTRTNLAGNLNELVASQWETIWPISQEFDLQVLKSQSLGQNHHLVLCHFRNITIINNQPTPRSGRATFILEKLENHWICIHSHLSESV